MLSAVSKAVNAEFKDGTKCYVEVPVQGCELPYLFVAQLQAAQEPDTRLRFNRHYFFDVRYHPDVEHGSRYREMARVAERLMGCLQLVPTDDTPVRASSVRSETVDGVLHVFADYPVRVMLPEPEVPDMETLEITEKIKEE
jgi:hypothetical protein